MFTYINKLLEVHEWNLSREFDDTDVYIDNCQFRRTSI